MGIYVKKGDILRGNKIECNARKLSRIKKKKQKSRTDIKSKLSHYTIMQNVRYKKNYSITVKNNNQMFLEYKIKNKRRILSLIFSFFFNSFNNTI